jgi:CheY-like chemotaxis protein
MILVAVDDLLFSSKIRATAKLVGVPLTFARTPEEVLTQARTLRPSLVIFDLDSQKVRPIEALALLKGDPELGSVPTLGFVSHVHAERIAEARAAGMEEVLARSAFAGRLSKILLSANTPDR